MFIDSNITKWKLPPWTDEEKKDLNKVVLDKVPTHFSTGHLVVAGSDTKNPYGKWLVAMNKLSAGRHINVGPVAAGVEPVDRHQWRQNENDRRSVHGARAALRADFKGQRNTAERSSIPKDRKQGSQCRLGQRRSGRDPQRQSSRCQTERRSAAGLLPIGSMRRWAMISLFTSQMSSKPAI